MVKSFGLGLEFGLCEYLSVLEVSQGATINRQPCYHQQLDLHVSR